MNGLMLHGGGSLYWGAVDSDLTNQFYPWHAFVHRWLSQGVFPFWDPHVFSGYPTVETQQMLALSPVHLLSLLMRPEAGLIFMMAAHTVIACAGMTWGLWRWGRLSAMAASLGGILYVTGALFAVRVVAGHFTVVAAMAWWPLAALSVLRVARDGAGLPVWAGVAMRRAPRWLQPFAATDEARLWSWGLIGASAGFHAMVILAGGPQYVIYLFYIDAAIVMAVARRRNFLGAVFAAGAAWGLALIITAPQWLPALWYLPYTGRAAAGGGGATGLNFQPLLNLWLEFIMPYPFGDDLTRGHLHFKNVWETATYPGMMTLVLTLALLMRVGTGLVRRAAGRAGRRMHVSPLAMAAVFILLLGAYMLVGAWLPGFGGFREPLKARAVLAFGMALASAAAADAMVRRAREWQWPMVGAAALCLGMLALAAQYQSAETFVALLKTFGNPMDPRAQPDYATALKNPAAAQLVFKSALVMAGAVAGAALLISAALRRWPRAGVAALVCVAMAEPAIQHGGSWLGRHPWRAVGLPAEIRQYFEPRLAGVRAGNDLPFRVILHSAIINRTHFVNGLYELYGYDPLMPAFAVGRLVVPGAMELQKSGAAGWKQILMERAGIRYDASQWLPKGVVPANWARADDETTATILEAPKACMFDVSRNVVAGSPGESVFGPDLAGRHYVLPEGEAGRLPASPKMPADFQREIANLFPAQDFATSATTSLGPGEFMRPVVGQRPDVMRLEVRLAAPALVVFKTTWLPGWRVIIDEKTEAGRDARRGSEEETAALFANNWMVAGIVGAGEHEVTFRYRPVGWRTSLFLSAVGIALATGMIIAGAKRGRVRRRNRQV